MDRAIAHVDLDAFFASVEEVLQPALRGRPIVVGGSGSPGRDTRGVVSSASYAARVCGVRSAMPLAQARRLCPHAVFLPVRHEVYEAHSRRAMYLLQRASPFVEQVSIDEAFVDLSESSWERSIRVARELQRAMRGETGLSASVGLSTTKLVAKIASDERKPAGFTVVAPGDEAAFLAPLPITRLWGVGPKTAEKLRLLGLRTNGDLAAAPEETLRRALGPGGADLRGRAQGVDQTPLQTSRQARSISAEYTFGRDTLDGAEVEHRMRVLGEGVASALRRQRLSGGTLTLKLRYRTFETLVRSATLLVPTDEAGRIVATALQLLRRVWMGQTPIRLVGVGVHGLVSAGRLQPSLFDAPNAPDRKLAGTLDRIRDRFGCAAVRRGVGP